MSCWRAIMPSRRIAATRSNNESCPLRRWRVRRPRSARSASSGIRIDTLLRQRGIADPFASFTASILWTAACGAVSALVFFHLAPQRGVMALLGVAVASVAAAYFALAYHALRVPVVGPLLAVTGV